MDIPAITFTRRDGSKFTLQPRPPRSFAARFDLAAEMGKEPTGALAMRMNCAALGMALTGQHPPEEPASTLPVYANDGNLMAYGGKVIEALSVRWQVVPDERFWLDLITLAALLVGSLPTAEGVKERENFTSATEAPSTSTSH